MLTKADIYLMGFAKAQAVTERTQNASADAATGEDAAPPDIASDVSSEGIRGVNDRATEDYDWFSSRAATPSDIVPIEEALAASGPNAVEGVGDRPG